MLARCLAVAAAVGALSPAAALAATHTVTPGETLWGIAVANRLPTSALAAANGLSPEAHVVAGATLTVPAPGTVAPGAGAGAPQPLGAYVVRPGDTLSELAVRSRVPLAQVAYMNGLDPDQPLLIGTVLKLPTGSPVAATSPPRATTVVPQAPPLATPERLSAAQVTSIAAQQGVPASLAAAIAWQESGFNNAMVSAANARGVMQILPGTWDWVQSNLSAQRLDPASAQDNVRAGSLYLARLLRETNGDPALAAAGYFQGLASVRQVGLLPATRQYVANVLALRSRFGG
jgi:LysM repeat protein